MSVSLRAIRYIELTAPAGMRAGHFRINTGQPPLVGAPLRPPFMEAQNDPHSIIFTKREAVEVVAIENAIDAALNA
ncbi:hypothetical protein [Actinokineospora sp. NPDC004072]